MTNGHWSDEDLIHRMYGVGPEEAARLAHLEACPECAARWQAVERQRTVFVESARSAQVDESLLRAQRDAVWRRLEEARRPWLWRMAPAGATALLLVFAVYLHRPAPQPEPAQVALYQQISDEQLFSEIASIADETAPRAVQPIQALFDAKAETEVQ